MNTSGNTYSPKILILGGGDGAPAIAPGIAEAFPNAQIDVRQGGLDHGGSSGEIRDYTGVAAPGDARNALVAFTDSDRGAIYGMKYGPDATIDTVRQSGDVLEEYIHQKSPDVDEAWVAMQLDAADELAAEMVEAGYSLEGHAYGNLHLGAVARQTGNMNTAIKAASTLLGLPENHTVAQTSDVPGELRLHDFDRTGKKITIDGEGKIDEYPIQNPEKAYVEPVASLPISEDLDQKIRGADIILIAPGSLMTSVAASLLAEGTPDAFANMKRGAVVIAVANLTEDEVTPSLDPETYIDKINEYINPDETGRSVDGLMFNEDTENMPEDVKPIVYDTKRLKQLKKLRLAIGGKFVSTEVVTKVAHDKVKHRTKVKTDGTAVGQALYPHVAEVMQPEQLAA